MEDIIEKYLSLIDNGTCHYDKHTYFWFGDIQKISFPNGEKDVDMGKHNMKDHVDIIKDRNTLSKLPPLIDAIKELTGASAVKDTLHLKSVDGVLQTFKYNGSKHSADSDLITAFDELLIEMES